MCEESVYVKDISKASDKVLCSVLSKDQKSPEESKRSPEKKTDGLGLKDWFKLGLKDWFNLEGRRLERCNGSH